MKTLISATLLLFSGTVLPAFSAESLPTRPSDELIIFASQPLQRRVAIGMTRQQLVADIGAPGAILDPNVWVYWNYKAVGIPAAEKYDTLIAVFKDGRVSLIQFCRSEPVRAFIAEQQGETFASAAK